jgi:hypothetical protein
MYINFKIVDSYLLRNLWVSVIEMERLHRTYHLGRGVQGQVRGLITPGDATTIT